MKKLVLISVLLLTGCSDSISTISNSIKLIMVACDEPVSMTMEIGTWGRSATVHCPAATYEEDDG